MDNFGSKDTILLVDDEQVVLDVGTLMIKKIGYKVLQAANGIEATKIFKENVDGICLVVLDMQLPDENGSTTCERLKGIKPDVKILHTSGLGRTPDGISFACGCNGFLLKPFRLEELSNKLKDLLENTSESIIHNNRPFRKGVLSGPLEEYKKQPNMTIKIYKGYEIEASAEQSEDNDVWSVTVCIYAHKDGHVRGRVFKPPEIQINQGEAIKYGLIMGQRIIDGLIEGFSIEEL